MRAPHASAFWRAGLPPVLLAALLGAAAAAGHADGLVPLPDLKLQVRVPAGWRVLEEVKGSGVTLGPADGRGPRLDILRWEPIAESLSPVAALRAHEKALAARYAYTPEGQEPAPAGAEGAVVVGHGVVRTPDGRAHAALFAACVLDKSYVILGTFCAPEEVAAVRRQFFDQALQSLAPLGLAPVPPVPPVGPGPTPPTPVTPVTPVGPGPGPTPPTPVTPVTPVTPTPVRPVVPGPVVPTPPVTPVGPGPGTGPMPRAAAHVPAELVEHRDRLGFTVQAPRGWSVTAAEGWVVMRPQQGPRRFCLGVLALRAQPELALQDRAVAAAEAWARRLGSAWAGLQTRLLTAEWTGAVSAGTVTVEGAALQTVVVLAPGDPVDLALVASLAPEADEEDRLALARTLAGFGYAPPEAGLLGGPWVTGDGALSLLREAGWELTGSARPYDGQVAIRVEGEHRASGARFVWQQPEVPLLKELTPDLEGAGWKEGAEFPPDFGTQPLALAPRPRPTQAAQGRAGAGGGGGVTTAATSVRAGELLPGGAGAVSRCQSPARVAVCICSVASAPAQLGPGCWMVASLRYEGPREAAPGAGGALRRAILSARPGPDWIATEEDRKALEDLLARARAAAAELPTAGPLAVSGPPPDWLAGLRREGDGPGPLQPPRDPTWLWKLATAADGARSHLPELLRDWWPAAR